MQLRVFRVFYRPVYESSNAGTGSVARNWDTAMRLFADRRPGYETCGRRDDNRDTWSAC